MNYKIENTGYKFRGYELGQKVMYKGKETTVIGFNGNEERLFIAIKSNRRFWEIPNNGHITHALDTAVSENCCAEWVYESDITIVKEKEKPMEKKMTKADLKGKWVKCIKGGLGHKSISNPQPSYKTGELYKINNSGGIGFNGSWYFCDWSTLLPNEFTINELNKSLRTNCGDVQFTYIGDYPQTQTKVKSDSPKSDKKSDKTNLSIKVKVDMLFDAPVIEETKTGTFIYTGRTTIYMSQGEYGIAVLNSKEINTYNKEIGSALAYKRCMDKVDAKS